MINDEDELECLIQDDRIKFRLGELYTNWMSHDDSFIKRIANLNKKCPNKHLTKEIEIKNTLDEGVSLCGEGKFPKAIVLFDDVLFYDDQYADALLNKSFALRGQKHFVKSLRYYKRAVKADDSLKDADYYRTLLKEANGERDNFPKLKLNIYAGDEYFAKGEFKKAVASYDKALVNPSKFKDKILSKLINKKATALVKLGLYEDALECFRNSLEVGENDYALYGEGLCQYKLNLSITDKFKTPLHITKRQMLRQAVILNDLGYFSHARGICDILCRNHFREDEFYAKLIETRKISING